jgi:glycosyltransferase involved in cell wall biosynthesis
MNVSVLLLTHNEAINLPRCLDALRWCDDIVTVDSGSTDGTIEIAEKRGVRVLRRAFDDFASQRNHGIENGQFRHEWILHLDADEVVTPELAKRLAEFAPPETVDAYLLPSKTIFRGKWLRHAGMYPAYQARLGRRDKLRFKLVGHGQREDLAPGRLATIDEPYLHFAFSHGPRAWLEKHLRYAADEVRDRDKGHVVLRDLLSRDPVLRRRTLKLAGGSVPRTLRPAARFVYVYVLRGGFLDGRAGLHYAFMLAVYEGMQSVLAMRFDAPE